jgi:DNA-binding protein HU-beta
MTTGLQVPISVETVEAATGRAHGHPKKISQNCIDPPFNQIFNFYHRTKTPFHNGGQEMNKAELVEKVAQETGLTKAQIEKTLDACIDTVKKTVKKGDEVKLVGFGTFTKAKRKARTGRNPQTGKTIKIPAAWYPKFRPGAEFKTMVR